MSLRTRNIRIKIGAMIVCVCNNVSSRDIASIAAGCCSFESLQERLQVGTCCGVCVPTAREAFDEHRAAPRPAQRFAHSAAQNASASA
jgi:bacterioferritin-associated ferredoxin